MIFVIAGLVALTLLTVLLGLLAYQLMLQGARVLERVEALEQVFMQQAFSQAPRDPHALNIGLPVGYIAPAFSLPDLDGNQRSLAEWRGRRILLIFFDAQSVFSRDMLPALAGMAADPAADRPLPLLLSRGSTAENQVFFDGAEVAWPVLCEVTDEVLQAYQADAAPSGYLIASDGTIESPLTSGLQGLLIRAGELTPHAHGSGEPSKDELRRDGLPVGSEAPVFRLPRLEGGELSLLDFRGRNTLVVFTDPDCEPCVALSPHLQAAAEEASELEVVLISRGDPAANAAHVAESGIKLPVALQRQWEVSREYGMFATPIAYLVDEWGIIAAEVAVGGEEILSLLASAGKGASAVPAK